MAQSFDMIFDEHIVTIALDADQGKGPLELESDQIIIPLALHLGIVAVGRLAKLLNPCLFYRVCGLPVALEKPT